MFRPAESGSAKSAPWRLLIFVDAKLSGLCRADNAATLRQNRAAAAGAGISPVADQSRPGYHGPLGRHQAVKVKSMVQWIASGIGLLIAYLLGSVPTGYLAGQVLQGIDIREHGSRSTGATNVLRTLGKWPALVVLLVDVAKGAAAILFALWFYPWLASWPSVTPPAPDPLSWVPWFVCLAGLA